MEINETACCGLREINGLSGYDNAKDAMMDLCEMLDSGDNGEDLPPNFAFILFTGIVRDDSGQKFAEYIRRHGLGNVRAGTETKNPNSGNIINAWVWSVNGSKLEQWYLKNKLDNDEEY